jgi:crotonobetainyl-CoA:carnitine CoA-transferase CaiB-like acyl-CoA transferase
VTNAARPTPTAGSPLAGVRVLDFGRIIAAPRAARYLADLGADVVHVEHPDGGDDTRADPYDLGHGLSGAFVQENWGKRSIALDLKHPRAMEVIEPLVRGADIVLENFRPGVMERLGMDYARLQTINPRIIMCSISGFGQHSAARSGAYGFIADAIAGFPDLTGDAGGPPVPSPVPVADVVASALAFGLISAALFDRARTGRGRHVDLALLDAAFAAHDMALQVYLSSGGSEQPTRRGANDPVRVPFGYFQARDGWLCLMCGSARHWDALVQVMGSAGQPLAPNRTLAQRQANQQDIYDRISTWVANAPSVERLVKLLEDAGVPAARLNTIAEAASDPRVLDRGLIQTVNHPVIGPLRIQNLLGPNADPRTLLPAPLLGQHTREIAKAAGLDDATIDGLLAAGCLEQPD